MAQSPCAVVWTAAVHAAARKAELLWALGATEPRGRAPAPASRAHYRPTAVLHAAAPVRRQAVVPQATLTITQAAPATATGGSFGGPSRHLMEWALAPCGPGATPWPGVSPRRGGCLAQLSF
jgi:hypothetical protein